MNTRLVAAAALGLLAAGAFVLLGTPDTGPDAAQRALPVVPPPLPMASAPAVVPVGPDGVTPPAAPPAAPDGTWEDDGSDAAGGSVLIGGDDVPVDDLPVPPELAATYADLRNAFEERAAALALCDRWSAPDGARPGSRLDLKVTVKRIHGDKGAVQEVVPTRSADPDGRYGGCVVGAMKGAGFRLPPGQDSAMIRFTVER